MNNLTSKLKSAAEFEYIAAGPWAQEHIDDHERIRKELQRHENGDQDADTTASICELLLDYKREYAKLRPLIDAMAEVIAMQDEAISHTENYLNWSADELSGDDLIGDGRRTARYKRALSGIERARAAARERLSEYIK